MVFILELLRFFLTFLTVFLLLFTAVSFNSILDMRDTKIEIKFLSMCALSVFIVLISASVVGCILYLYY